MLGDKLEFFLVPLQPCGNPIRFECFNLVTFVGHRPVRSGWVDFGSATLPETGKSPYMGRNATLLAVKYLMIPGNENALLPLTAHWSSAWHFLIVWLGAPCVRFSMVENLRLLSRRVPGQVEGYLTLALQGLFSMQLSCKLSAPFLHMQHKNACMRLLAALIWGRSQWNTVPWLAEILPTLTIGQPW